MLSTHHKNGDTSIVANGVADFPVALPGFADMSFACRRRNDTSARASASGSRPRARRSSFDRARPSLLDASFASSSQWTEARSDVETGRDATRVGDAVDARARRDGRRVRARALMNESIDVLID